MTFSASLLFPLRSRSLPWVYSEVPSLYPFRGERAVWFMQRFLNLTLFFGSALLLAASLLSWCAQLASLQYVWYT